MRIFQVDEKVRVNAPYYPQYLDREGIVVDVRNDGYSVQVEFVGGTRAWFFPGELSPID